MLASCKKRKAGCRGGSRVHGDCVPEGAGRVSAQGSRVLGDWGAEWGGAGCRGEWGVQRTKAPEWGAPISPGPVLPLGPMTAQTGVA